MHSAFSIREASVDDAAAIAQLCGELGYAVDEAAMRDRLTSVLELETDLVIVAMNSSGVIVGWLQAHAAHIIESGFRVEITGLSVASTFRRGGVGRELVKRAEQWARSLRATAIVVRSNVNRVESHFFYPALGYTISKTQKVYRKNLSA